MPALSAKIITTIMSLQNLIHCKENTLNTIYFWKHRKPFLFFFGKGVWGVHTHVLTQAQITFI